MGYVEATNAKELNHWIGLLPNASSNLIISLSEKEIEFDTARGKTLLHTAYSKRAAIRGEEGLSFINIQFSPFGLHNLMNLPMVELHNTSLSLDHFLPQSDCEMLADKLISSKLAGDKFDIIEAYLRTFITNSRIDARVEYATKLIKQYPSISMEKLSDLVCLSSRRLRKLFSEQTGFSPGYFKKLSRFNSATKQLEKEDFDKLSDVAFDNKYFDQAHFIKDFRHFSGLSPKDFLKQKADSSDFYNFLLPDLNRFDFR